MIALPDYWFDKSGTTQRRSTTLDSSGGPVTTYADYLVGVSARIVPHGGGESGGQQRLNTQNPVTIYLKGAPDVVAEDRFVYASRVYDIVSVNNPDEQNAYLILDCYEVKPSGVGA